MNSFFRNTISKLYNAVSAPAAATRNALSERMQSLHETASLLYNRMMGNMGYGRERLKDIVEKEAAEKKPKSNSKNQKQRKKKKKSKIKNKS